MTLQILMNYLGYLASFIVLISLLMKSIIKLRFINTVGALLFTVYAVFLGAWPVVVLNFSLVLINIYYLISYKIKKEPLQYDLVAIDPKEISLLTFYTTYYDDIVKFFGNVNMDIINCAFILMKNDQIAGIIMGIKQDKTLDIKIDFVSPAYRDFTVGYALYRDSTDLLAGRGIYKLTMQSNNKDHIQYLLKTGFTQTEHNNFFLTLNDSK